MDAGGRANGNMDEDDLMALLQYGEWKPDVSDYEGSSSKTITNVVPQGDGYGPIKDFTAVTSALPGPCRGGFYGLKSDGSVALFGATSTQLYILNNTDYTWKPVSKPAAVTSISNASPAVITYTNTFVANEPVVFSTSGTLPTGLVAGTVYYVLSAGLSSASFRVSATAGGAAINTSSAGSGTHSVTANYSTLTSSANWQFAQFGSFVLVTQANVVLQLYDLSSSTAFADCLGSPPQAAYISIVGRFAVLSGLLSFPYRIQWSGLNSVNASTSWTSGVNSSDYQDFSDGGVVRGVAGGEFGTIFQDQAIRRMVYSPGSAVIFQITRMTQDQGLFAPYSIITAGTNVFFYSARGFFKVVPGGLPEQIGRERVDRTFFTDLDKSSPQLFIGAADPRTSRVYWAYKSIAGGVTAKYDKIIGYDYVLDRWFTVVMNGQYLLGLSQPGITLEGLDSISASLDALTSSLDSFATVVLPEFSQFNSSNVLGFFRGTNLEATMDTAEQGWDAERIFVKGFRPVTDAATVYGSVTYRETTNATATYTSETLINSRTGRIDLRRSTRYARLQSRIPAGTTWTFSVGVEPDIAQTGEL